MLKSYTSWTVWNTEDGKKVIADNNGRIMDREAVYETMRSILEFYDSVSDSEIIEFNKELQKEQYEYFEAMENQRKEQRQKEREYKPTYMFIIKKVDEPCYKFKFGGHRIRGYANEKRLTMIQEQLDFRLANIEKESEVPIELVNSFLYVHNAPGIYRYILETYGSFRDEFDWYVLEDKFLDGIIKYIKKEILEG